MPKRNRKMNHLIAVRLDDAQLDAVNAWRQKQPDPPTKAEAIRQLMERGLDAERGERPTKGAKR
jgi:hypothetical protein